MNLTASFFNDSNESTKTTENNYNAYSLNLTTTVYNKKTQNAISEFCNRFSKKTNHPLNELVYFFKKNL